MPGASLKRISTIACEQCALIRLNQGWQTTPHRLGEEAGHAGERGEQRRGPERVILRDIARREARRAPRLQPGAVVEL